MNKQQSGFTLIELVVVIVIIGILAAAAIPRFANLTDDARQATAEGILGAILSSAVIQFGANRGEPVTFFSIIENTSVSTDQLSVAVSTDNGGSYTAIENVTDGSPGCVAGNDDQIAVRVDADDATVAGQEAFGVIPSGLCEL